MADSPVTTEKEPASPVPPRNRWLEVVEWCGVSLLILLLSLLYTYPLCFHPGDYLQDAGDPMQHISVSYWTSRKLLSGHWAGMWNLPPMYYPARHTLSYGDPQFGTTLLGLPFFAATGNIALAYNMVVLVSIPLGALGMYALVRHLLRSRKAGLVAALIWGFGTWHSGQYSHQQLLSLEFLPFLLLALHRYGETRRARYLVWLSLAWLAQEFMAAYWGGFLLLLIAPCAFLLLRVSYRQSWRDIARAALAVAIAVIPWFLALLPLLAGAKEGRRHPMAEVLAYSADLADYLPTRGTWLWGTLGTVHIMPGSREPSGEFMISPGLIGLLLAGVAACWLLRYQRFPVSSLSQATASARETAEGEQARSEATMSEAITPEAIKQERGDRLFHLLERIGPYLSLTCVALWTLMAAWGVGELTFFGFPAWLVNSDTTFRGFWLGLLLWNNARVRALLARYRGRFVHLRSPLFPYLVLAALATIWSCGYEIKLFQRPILGGLHGYLTWLPGTHSFRALCRMGILADFAWAVLAAYGLTLLWRKWLQTRKPGVAARGVVFVGLCLLLLAESVPRQGTSYRLSQPLPDPRPVDRWLARQPAGPLIALPLTVHPYLEGERLWQQVTHHKPMRNGCETFYPSGYYEEAGLFAAPQSAEAIARLRALGIRFVVLETDNRYAGQVTMLGQVPQMPASLSAPYLLRFTDTSVKVYELPSVPVSRPETRSGTPGSETAGRKSE